MCLYLYSYYRFIIWVFYLYILNIFCFSSVVYAQQLQGKVLDKAQKPIAYAQLMAISANKNINIKNTEKIKYYAVSDTLGNFLFEEMPFGEYDILVQHTSFQDFSKKINITNKTKNDKNSENQGVEIQVFTQNFVLETIDENLEEVVISGTLKETTRLLSPILVEVFTKDYFRKNISPQLFESLNMINGVQTQNNCNVCNTGDIRLNGMDGAYTMVTIDNMPIVSGLGTVYGLVGIPNSFVQKIEIVKGASSTLYGSEALAGTLNITTQNPEKAPKLALEFNTTTWLEKSLDIGFKYKLGKNINVLTGVNLYHFDEKIDQNHDNFLDIALQQRVSFFQKYQFKRKENRLANFLIRYIYEDRLGGELQWKRENRGGNEVYGESIFTNRLEILGVYQLPFKEKILLQYAYNDHIQDSYYGEKSYYAHQKIAFGQFLWDKRIGKHDFLMGLPFRYTYYLDNTVATFNETTQTNVADNRFLFGAFFQDEIHFSEKFTTLIGLRNDYTSVHGNIFSPRISLKYAFTPNNIWRMTAGNGFRIVNLFTEDHSALTGARKVILSEKLNPETSYSLTLNNQLHWDIKDWEISWENSVFYTYFYNRILPDYDTNPTQIIYANLQGYAITRGFSSQIDVSNKGFKSSLGVSVLESFRVEKNDLGENERTNQYYTPDFTANLNIGYTFSKSKFSLDLTAKYTGNMRMPTQPQDERPEYSPAYTIVNVQARKQWGKGIEVYLGIKNIFNFVPQNPFMRPFDPFNKQVNFDAQGLPQSTSNNPNANIFDTAYSYAPLQGIRGILGVSVKF